MKLLSACCVALFVLGSSALEDNSALIQQQISALTRFDEVGADVASQIASDYIFSRPMSSVSFGAAADIVQQVADRDAKSPRILREEQAPGSDTASQGIHEHMAGHYAGDDDATEWARAIDQDWRDRGGQRQRSVDSMTGKGSAKQQKAAKMKLENYKVFWSNFMEEEKAQPSFNQPITGASKTKIVLGIMDTDEDDVKRQVVRDTWMKQDGICKIECALMDLQDRRRLAVCPAYECSIYVAFVHGVTSDSDTLISQKTFTSAADPKIVDGDELLFDFDDNKNNGKVTAWFEYAVRKFEWATHIGKMDFGTFPHLHNLMNIVARHDLEEEPLQYLGQKMTSHDCLTPMEEIEAGSPEGNYCVYGYLYLLSRDLADEVVNDDSTKILIWNNVQKGWDATHEDQAMGQAVTFYQRKNKKHIVTLPLKDVWSVGWKASTTASYYDYKYGAQ